MSRAPVAPTPAALAAAAERLRAGSLVAFPTETVYGLGADAARDDAAARIFAAKGRPASHPLIVHLADAAALDDWAAEIPAAARALAAAFWPGPLTLVLRRSPRVADAVTGGLPTVGLRVPSHPVAQALLAAFGGGLAAPSANRFGSVSPTCAEDVREELGDRVDMILDGGRCPVGVESTIVDLSGAHPRLLRPGGVPREALESVLGRPLLTIAAGEEAAAAQAGIRAPGLLASHYAPRAQVRLLLADALVAEAQRLIKEGERVALVLGAEAAALADGLPGAVSWTRLPSEDAGAHDLYAALRAADHAGATVVLATLPPETGLGLAVADRLRRAAGPR